MVWLRQLSGRMVTKIFLAIGLVVGAALIVKGQADGRRLADVMRRETQLSAHALARSIVASIDHAMLQGEGISVKALIEELKHRLPAATIQIYDPRGLEVFAPRPPPPRPETLPPAVAAALDDGQRRTDAGVIVKPIAHEPRCARCHRKEDRLRGALALRLDERSCAERRDRTVARIVEAGFTHVMTARNADELDAYFAELVARAPGVRAVAVLDAAGDPAFASAEDVVLDPDAVSAALQPGATPTFVPAADDGMLATVPLRMDERCVECHEEALGATRGVLAVVLAAPAPGCAAEELEALTEVSLRYIMLSALGRRIADFLDAVATTGAVTELELYDPQGRRYWTTTHPPPPARLAGVLGGGAATITTIGAGAGERVEVVEPLPNRKECTRCHGVASPLRGAVAVSLSTAQAAAERRDAVRASTIFTGATLAGILVILGALLQFLVVRPVNRIGQVADAVGLGNLDVTVRPADPLGDEMSRLGARVNEMVVGLRTKSALEKFVSRGTAAAAAGAAAGTAHPEGERRQMTVLFSDIRGFTTYSEERAPEEVVAALNQLLGVQAEAVQRFGGDIDKFIGDELMALFWGADAERRAIACAVAMIDAVAALGRDELEVGVGVHAGEVVYGAIGHRERLDFTVIGDVVNTGARLCSAAAGGEILVSVVAREAAGDVDGVSFEPRAPLPLKGKRKPFDVVAAHRRPAG